MTPLHSLRLKCSACGGREVELWLFVKRDEAEARVDEWRSQRGGRARFDRFVRNLLEVSAPNLLSV
jgi:hypothetical protein